MASLEIRGGVWHLRWRDKRGKSRSLSTKLHSSPKNDILAKKKLVAFEADLLRGKIPELSLRIGALLDDLIRDYEANGKKSTVDMKCRLEKHLRPWFGEMRVDRFGADDWREYITHRQPEAQNASINRERAALARAFMLAYQAGRIESVPFIPRLKEAAPRAGFVSRSELESLCRHLPEWICPFVRFGFLTGWRLSEIQQLQWRHVYFEAGEIRLDPGSTKNGEARVFPVTQELRGLLEAAKVIRVTNPTVPTSNAVGVIRDAVPTLTPHVFIKDLLPISFPYYSWKKAANAIGKPGLIFHDLRRSAVREFIRSGMDERLAMQLTGHRTNEVFKRYRIVAESDLERAREMMERGKSVHASAGTREN